MLYLVCSWSRSCLLRVWIGQRCRVDGVLIFNGVVDVVRTSLMLRWPVSVCDVSVLEYQTPTGRVCLGSGLATDAYITNDVLHNH